MNKALALPGAHGVQHPVCPYEWHVMAVLEHHWVASETASILRDISCVSVCVLTVTQSATYSA